MGLAMALRVTSHGLVTACVEVLVEGRHGRAPRAQVQIGQWQVLTHFSVSCARCLHATIIVALRCVGCHHAEFCFLV